MPNWIRLNGELICLLTLLAAPIWIDPTQATHFSFCLFHRAGLDFCPGCGLGKSLAWLYRGSLVNSWQQHPLALPALLILVHRVALLIRNTLLTVKKTRYE